MTVRPQDSPACFPSEGLDVRVGWGGNLRQPQSPWHWGLSLGPSHTWVCGLSLGI